MSIVVCRPWQLWARRCDTFPMGRAFVAISVAFGLAAVACGGSTASAPSTQGSTTSMVATTESTTTTTSMTTTLAPTTSATLVATTTTTIASAADWTPACRALVGGPNTALINERALDTFGRLAAAPNLDITMPRAKPFPGNQVGPAAVRLARVEGGVLLGIFPSSSDETNSGLLAVVNHDGSKRWVECVAGRLWSFAVAPPSRHATTAAIGLLLSMSTTGEATIDWHAVSLVDGSTTPWLVAGAHVAGMDAAVLASQREFARSTTKLLLGHAPPESGYFTNVDRLTLIDLVANTVLSLPIPPEAKGSGIESISYEINEHGDVYLTDSGQTGGYGAPAKAVFHNDAWTRDAASIAAARSSTIVWGDYPDGHLMAIDAVRRSIWTNTTVYNSGAQGQVLVTDGAITIVSISNSPDNQDLATIAIDTATGVERWRKPGLLDVPVAADGFAIVSDRSVLDQIPGGYHLIDDRTGKTVDATQAWPDPGAFAQECCGGGEWVWTTHNGALVFAVNGDHIRIWYPRGLATGTRAITVP